MHKDLDSVCTALDSLATTIVSGWSSDGTMTDALGWFAPVMTRQELAGLAKSLAEEMRSTDVDEVAESIRVLVLDLPRRLQILQTHTVPHFYDGNGGQAIPAYIATISFLRATLLPPMGWQTMPDPKALPANLTRRARAALAELDQLTPNIANLSQQIADIQSAHTIADTLPIDLQALAEARVKLERASSESAVSAAAIKEARETSATDLLKMQDAYTEAEKLVQQCEAAYHITTTKGLAGAFDQRAGKLAWSMWTWVFGLIIALGTGSLIGANRLELLSKALSVPNPNVGSVAMQALLSILSVGAPLWFAWIATKQIGQRFRLAEDYAFKASVAKAYEGYRKEATRIDPAFVAQLFGSALARLDEAPLRLIETNNHGSPWHELANSEGVRRAFRTAPELREEVSVLLRRAMETTTKASGKGEPSPAKTDASTAAAN